MYLIFIFLPLISSITAGLFGHKIGHKGSCFLTVLYLFLTFLISIFIFYEVSLMSSPVYIKLISWIDSSTFNVDWGFLFDSLTTVMCCVVSFISFIVHLYSVEYMSSDPHLSRFMSYLSLFTFFMLILITADNYVQMFVGWEGVGLCSYLLINFWFTRIQANKAAIKAMILNRIGDFGLALGIFSIYITFKSVDYSTVFSLAPLFIHYKINFLIFEINSISLICFLLFIGAMGKSAQLGLHTWLPDAMEGPTPVSALIHAATMVTAGVFLLARSSVLLEYSFSVLEFITILGALTAFISATIGLTQNDLKKVIAYSTCSQLGYMVFSCGLSNYNIGMFHLMNHAFFKALLFLSAGSVIHAVADEQDMRKMGGLKKLTPFTYSMMIIGSLALMGFPFLTGFYSKDVILEVAYGKYTTIGHFSYFLGSFGAFLTAFYSIRLICLTFLVKPNGFKKVLTYSADSSYNIVSSLAILAIPSIFIGFFFKDMLIGMGTDFWGNSIYISSVNCNLIESEFINYFFKIFPVLLSCLGALSSFFTYIFFNNILISLKLKLKVLYTFLNRKWFFDKLYNEIFVQKFLNFSYNTSYKLMDKGIIEIFGPLGFSNTIFSKANVLNSINTKILYHYAFTILLSITLILGLYQFYFFFNLLINFKIFLIFFLSFFFFAKTIQIDN
uniref:NADH-ubiquinone oxidoreductase chain 5 n=1 Tax=Coscinodiscus granii TaxID=265552 RepID=A0A8A6W350_9STRA|nr:NADH dehydrogenase subunit 5 [Coscinodiscus granii]QTK21653.1 NADH dehydrogenase subunit 5 [Coscinodiscus granii]